MQIIWDNKANIDLAENIKYIAKKSPQNALMVLDTLLELPNSLIIFPYSYPIEPFYGDENGVLYQKRYHLHYESF
tara:strand:+ start:639 stop:863 length:225 start_codon:yes stop_codon:yes gene_type:complete